MTLSATDDTTGTRVARGLASLVLNELPVSLAEAELGEATDLTDRIRSLALAVTTSYGIDYLEHGPLIIGHVLDHLTGYLPGLEPDSPADRLPKQPFCDPATAWAVNHLGEAGEGFPAVVIAFLRHAADDFAVVPEPTPEP